MNEPTQKTDTYLESALRESGCAGIGFTAVENVERLREELAAVKADREHIREWGRRCQDEMEHQARLAMDATYERGRARRAADDLSERAMTVAFDLDAARDRIKELEAERDALRLCSANISDSENAFVAHEELASTRAESDQLRADLDKALARLVTAKEGSE